MVKLLAGLAFSSTLVSVAFDMAFFVVHHSGSFGPGIPGSFREIGVGFGDVLGISGTSRRYERVRRRQLSIWKVYGSSRDVPGRRFLLGREKCEGSLTKMCARADHS